MWVKDGTIWVDDEFRFGEISVVHDINGL